MAVTHFPEALALDQATLNQFDWGGKFPVTRDEPWKIDSAHVDRLAPQEMSLVPNTNAFLAARIHDFLTGSRYHVCLFEDANAQPGDPRLTRTSTPFVTLGDDVFFYMTPALLGGNDHAIRDLLRTASSWLVIGVLTSLHDAIWLRNRGAIETEDARILADRASEIIVGAYDGEGYVVWTPAE